MSGMHSQNPGVGTVQMFSGWLTKFKFPHASTHVLGQPNGHDGACASFDFELGQPTRKPLYTAFNTTHT